MVFFLMTFNTMLESFADLYAARLFYYGILKNFLRAVLAGLTHYKCAYIEVLVFKNQKYFSKHLTSEFLWFIITM